MGCTSGSYRETTLTPSSACRNRSSAGSSSASMTISVRVSPTEMVATSSFLSRSRTSIGIMFRAVPTE